ncbi:NADH-cytochrome b5 reductase-like [Chionoecetes opilio]|uniref:NADH-cytochrome b5 reductase n=1 Tax=Chionoecetes opilio TaxID=41210 RepID=A0A8J4YL21_CHIOP|nr:NADH-cytochrome b5 reductase-like [Chionoecetes opilio]
MWNEAGLVASNLDIKKIGTLAGPNVKSWNSRRWGQEIREHSPLVPSHQIVGDVNPLKTERLTNAHHLAILDLKMEDFPTCDRPGGPAAPQPRAPHPSDCCGTGCCPCVHDIYEHDLKAWQRQRDLIRNGKQEERLISAALEPHKWTEFEIIRIDRVNSSTFLYSFKIADNQTLGIQVGQHIIVKQEKNGRVYTRQYTPVTDVDKQGVFEVLIKIYPNGKVTQIIKEWKMGDLIPWRGPFGDFLYATNTYKRVLMLAAGTGIAPMHQIIKKVVENEDDETSVKLYYASKTFSDVLLRESLAEFCQYWNFTMRYYLSDESDVRGNRRYREEVEARRVGKAEVQEELERGPLHSTLVLVCGTKSFEKDMVNSAKNANIPDENIYKF